MNPRADRRLLRRLERDLAHSDPHLKMLFASFTVQAWGAEMPGTEMIRTRPLRLFEWLGRRADRHSEGSDGHTLPRTHPRGLIAVAMNAVMKVMPCSASEVAFEQAARPSTPRPRVGVIPTG